MNVQVLLELTGRVATHTCEKDPDDGSASYHYAEVERSFYLEFDVLASAAQVASKITELLNFARIGAIDSERESIHIRETTSSLVNHYNYSR